MTITVSFTDSKKPEEQILVLHKLLWLHAREVISIDVQNAPSTYSFYSLLKKDIQVEDLDFFIELDINHSILGSIAYQTLFGAETYFPEMHDKPITEKSNHYGDWFNMESYIEAENWIKENKGKVFSPHFDLMQVLPYDGNAKEHLAYLEKLCWLAEKEYVFFSTYSHIDKDCQLLTAQGCELVNDFFKSFTFG